jgi:hypothetical protein
VNGLQSGLRKEVITMTAKRIDIKDYCDSLYTELFDIKSRLGEFVSTIDQIEGKKSGVLSSYGKHLHELISCTFMN